MTAGTRIIRGTAGSRAKTNDPQILALRIRQAKNFLATLLLSQGVPMLTAGDEFLRTQKGNNNAWCQDNETSWVDWSLAEKNKDFLRFVREMIQFRKRHPALRRTRFFRGEFTRPEVVNYNRPARATAASSDAGPEDAARPGLAGPCRPTSTGTAPSHSPRTSRPSHERSP